MPGKKWDAIVIGAGPAGASAARMLSAGGMDCMLIEKKKLPRHKMCSGILSRWTMDFVHRNFGAIPEKVYCQPNFLDGVALHYPSLSNPVLVPALEPIPNVWRSGFDHFLAMASKTKIRDRLKLQHIEHESGGFKVTCRRRSRDGRSSTFSFKSTYVVAADGCNSRSVRQMMPHAYQGLPWGTGMQLHYKGDIDLDPKHYNMFFYPDMGFYSWANIKDDDIHVGVAGIGTRKLPPYHAKFVSLLEKKYGLRIRETRFREGMAAVMLAPLNRFVLGKGNFLAVGDAAGFVHAGGEGISCALTTGDLAARAVLTAAKTGGHALYVYREIVREEAELCLDQFNPLKMIQNSPIPVDFKAVWRNHSLKEMYGMWQDLKAYGTQDNGFSETGIGKISKQNMLHHLRHGRYPIQL